MKKHSRQSAMTGNLISPTNALRAVLEQEEWNDILAPNLAGGSLSSYGFLEMLRLFSVLWKRIRNGTKLDRDV